MGREIKRVPLDFDFPLGESFHDHAYEKHREECEACRSDDDSDCEDSTWREAPKGDGWQLWQTVSDGPISPVFATPEALVDFMCRPDLSGRVAQGYSPWDCGWRREVADRFVRAEGWAPSMVYSGGVLQGGAEAMYADDGLVRTDVRTSTDDASDGDGK